MLAIDTELPIRDVDVSCLVVCNGGKGSMIVFMMNTIILSEGERRELSQRAASRSGRADDGRRARLILLLAARHTWAQIRDKLGCNDAFIARWSNRFGQERL